MSLLNLFMSCIYSYFLSFDGWISMLFDFTFTFIDLWFGPNMWRFLCGTFLLHLALHDIIHVYDCTRLWHLSILLLLCFWCMQQFISICLETSYYSIQCIFFDELWVHTVCSDVVETLATKSRPRPRLSGSRPRL